MRITVLIILFFANLNAQWQINGVAVCDTAGKQHIAANGIISDGKGGAFIVWGDNRENWDIYAQHVDSLGRMLWGKQGMPICSTEAWQFAPIVTPDHEGGFVVAWGDMRNDERDVYAQRIGKNGNNLWKDNGIAVVTEEQYQAPVDIIETTDSCFIISWTDGRNFPDTNFVYVQKIDKNGKLLWDSSGVKVSNQPWGDSRLVSDEKGGVLVFWPSSENENLLGQRIDKNGNRKWTNNGVIVSMNNASQNNTSHTVTPDDFGGAYIAWDYNDTDKCYLQRLDSLGNRLWGVSGIQIFSNEVSQNIPVIHKINSDSVIYLWQDNFYIRMQIFSKEGERKFIPKGIKLTNYQTSRYISSIYDNRILLISHPEIINFFPNEFIVRVQKTNSTGHLFWDSSGVVASDVKISPNVVRGFSVPDGHGGIITAWDDDRNDTTNSGITDIYIQRISKNGKVGGDTITSLSNITRNIPNSYKLMVYPNPFNNTINIEYVLDKKQPISLKIFDIQGRIIKTVNTIGFPGKNKRTWNGTNNDGKEVSSGIYIISIAWKHTTVLRKVFLLK